MKLEERSSQEENPSESCEGHILWQLRKFSLEEPFSLERRALLLLGGAELLNLILPWRGLCFASVPKKDYSLLYELTQLESIDEPLLTFCDYGEDPDQETKDRIMSDIALRQDLLERVFSKFGSTNQVRLTFDSLQVKLLFVPEIREKFADAYKKFCTQAIDYILHKTKLGNPYHAIVNPLEANPKIPGEGKIAYLVHQLGKQYKAICTFTNEEGRSVKYQLKGAFFSKHLGAVDVDIEFPQEGVYKLTRRNYSIWQDRAKNVCTLLNIPIEETLHFIIGRYTDRKIEEELQKETVTNVSEVKRIAEYWMSVEEAIIGGLAKIFIRDFLKGQFGKVSSSQIELDHEKYSQIPQYKFRSEGITLVERMGYEQALDVYMSDPGNFNRLLIRHSKQHDSHLGNMP